jgi:aryl carrier-like protein
MVPAAFVKLDKLPLSPNGKLDRKALPDPGKNAFASGAFEAPVGEVEQKMAVLWAELLKIEQVGRHDNFFELGGHSLLAMTLIERMQQQGLAGDVRALFTTPTIAGLANAADSRALQSAAPENRITPGSSHITPEMLPLIKLEQGQIDRILDSVPGGAANVQDIYPLAPLQEGILFQHLMTAKGDPYLAPFMLGFDKRERLDGFLQALQHIVDRHDVLRTAMVWKDVDAPLQVVLRQVSVPVEEVTINAEAQLLQRFDPAVYRLDLSKAPLLHAVVAHEAALNRWLLLLLTHHLILDHTSMAIVVGELRALMADAQAALPPAMPYRNFVAQTIQGTTNEEHEAFFRRLVGALRITRHTIERRRDHRRRAAHRPESIHPHSRKSACVRRHASQPLPCGLGICFRLRLRQVRRRFWNGSAGPHAQRRWRRPRRRHVHQHPAHSVRLG